MKDKGLFLSATVWGMKDKGLFHSTTVWRMKDKGILSVGCFVEFKITTVWVGLVDAPSR